MIDQFILGRLFPSSYSFIATELLWLFSHYFFTNFILFFCILNSNDDSVLLYIFFIVIIVFLFIVLELILWIFVFASSSLSPMNRKIYQVQVCRFINFIFLFENLRVYIVWVRVSFISNSFRLS